MDNLIPDHTIHLREKRLGSFKLFGQKYQTPITGKPQISLEVIYFTPLIHCSLRIVDTNVSLVHIDNNYPLRYS